MTVPPVDVPARLREKARVLRLTMPISRTEPSTWRQHADLLDLLADAYEALHHQAHGGKGGAKPIVLQVMSRIEEAAR